MKHFLNKQVLCLLLVLALCLSLPMLTPKAQAETPQALLVLVDREALREGSADKLVEAKQDVIDRVLGNTKVCPETQALLEEGKAVEAELNHTEYGVRALTALSDGTKIAVRGHAVLEYRGEYLFGGKHGLMVYGFQEEEGGTRYYSPVSLQKFDLLDGRMPSDTTLFIADQFYAVDENGYIDTDNPVERDEKLWARYWRAEYCQGLPLHNFLSFNATLCIEHAFDWDHPNYRKKPSTKEPGYEDYVCPRCGAQETIILPIKKST